MRGLCLKPSKCSECDSELRPMTTMRTLSSLWAELQLLVHRLTWERSSYKKNSLQMESVDDESCVFKACEEHVKRHITVNEYRLLWRAKTDKNHYRCTVPYVMQQVPMGSSTLPCMHGQHSRPISVSAPGPLCTHSSCVAGY